MFGLFRVHQCQMFGPVPPSRTTLVNTLIAARTSSNAGSPVRFSSCKLHCSRHRRLSDGKLLTTTCPSFSQWKHSIASRLVNPVKSRPPAIGLYDDAQ